MKPYKLLIFIILLCLSNSVIAQTIPQYKLDTLIKRAKRANSDGLIVVQDNRILTEEYFGQAKTPTYIASVAKALVGVAITKLLSDGKIKSLDQPIADFYPEWRQGRKKHITLRMIVSHTSGMQNEKNTRLEIETGPNGVGDDLVKLALAAEIVDEPGTIYNYNNKAICLLPGIIEKASGLRMDHYFEQNFFRPMGIKTFDWKRDATGTPQGHAGMKLMPVDLAKFGQLMLGKGLYNGRRYFDARWADTAIAASQQVNAEVGIIWNRFVRRINTFYLDEDAFERMKRLQVPDSIVNKLRPLLGKELKYEVQKRQELQKYLTDNELRELGRAIIALPKPEQEIFKKKALAFQVGYHHSGSWGNFLIIIPDQKLVIVRVVKRDEQYKEQTDLMGGFTSSVFDLFRTN